MKRYIDCEFAILLLGEVWQAGICFAIDKASGLFRLVLKYECGDIVSKYIKRIMMVLAILRSV